MPQDNLVTIPDHVGFDQAALAEPIACGWHAVRLGKAALDRPLQTANCLVIGGGAIGLGAALVLQAHGARNIQIGETNAIRRETVARAGDFQLFDPSGSDGPSDGSIDLVIDGVGYAATRAAASRAAKPGGVIVHIGLGDGEGGLDIRRMTLQEITFIGTYTYTPQDFSDTAAAIFDGRLGDLDWIETGPSATEQKPSPISGTVPWQRRKSFLNREPADSSGEDGNDVRGWVIGAPGNQTVSGRTRISRARYFSRSPARLSVMTVSGTPSCRAACSNAPIAAPPTSNASSDRPLPSSSKTLFPDDSSSGRGDDRVGPRRNAVRWHCSPTLLPQIRWMSPCSSARRRQPRRWCRMHAGPTPAQIRSDPAPGRNPAGTYGLFR